MGIVKNILQIESEGAGVAPKMMDSLSREMVQGCTAWVNFNGTAVVAIRDSFNVSSITDNGAGDYSVNFATAMANINYCISGSAGRNNFALINMSQNYAAHTPTVSACRVQITYANTLLVDATVVHVATFGGI